MRKNVIFIFSLIIFILIPAKAWAVSNELFKGVWVATAYNIDWNNKDSQSQYIEDLDLIKDIGLNSVIFQVRPMGDAFYKSEYSPWSKYITGNLGEEPSYDPLEFAIKEAKSRGLKFHAWFNPFRISSDANFNVEKYLEELPSNSKLKMNPQWIVKYGKYHWINIGEPEARDYAIDIIKEVVKKYDVDGVHIDDYFYPYPVSGIEFPDEEAYLKYGDGYLSKADWRRDNVNKFVKKLSSEIKGTKKKVEFGISPFGIWKNKVEEGGAGTKGLSSYHDLYCDTVNFIENEWIDYVIPQLYWDINSENTPYNKLADWWAEKTNGKKTKLYIGHAGYKDFSEDEIKNQIMYNKSNEAIKGSCFYSMRDIRNNNKKIQEQIKSELKNDIIVNHIEEENPINMIAIMLTTITIGIISIGYYNNRKETFKKKRSK